MSESSYSDLGAVPSGASTPTSIGSQILPLAVAEAASSSAEGPPAQGGLRDSPAQFSTPLATAARLEKFYSAVGPGLSVTITTHEDDVFVNVVDRDGQAVLMQELRSKIQRFPSAYPEALTISPPATHIHHGFNSAFWEGSAVTASDAEIDKTSLTEEGVAVITTDASGFAGGAWWKHRRLQYAFDPADRAPHTSANWRELHTIVESV